VLHHPADVGKTLKSICQGHCQERTLESTEPVDNVVAVFMPVSYSILMSNDSLSSGAGNIAILE
jgi:hypothetical protein